jgi:hypothetical protein
MYNAAPSGPAARLEFSSIAAGTSLT